MGLFYEYNKDSSYNKYEVKTVNVIVFFTILFIIIVVGLMAFLPKYNVWSQGLAGQAKLREAEFSKKVQIEEALANLESEKLNAQAEVERAKGAAESIAIEGGSLTPEYIQYLWVRQNQFNEKTTIYIPTEANLPILEAGRLQQ